MRRVGEGDEEDVPGASLVPSAEGQVIKMTRLNLQPICGWRCVRAAASSGRGRCRRPRLELVVLNDNRWGAGYCQDYSVQNISDENVVDWAVRIMVPGPITSGYTAARDGDDGWVVFTPNADWARTIRPGQQVTFGFCGISKWLE